MDRSSPADGSADLTLIGHDRSRLAKLFPWADGTTGMSMGQGPGSLVLGSQPQGPGGLYLREAGGSTTSAGNTEPAEAGRPELFRVIPLLGELTSTVEDRSR